MQAFLQEVRPLSPLVVLGVALASAIPNSGADLSPGTVDPGFSPLVNGTVNVVAVQTDGRIVIGGEFTKVNGVARGAIARLNEDGSLDSSFATLGGADGYVHALALQPDGHIVAAGDFGSVNGASWTRVARLNSDGAPDPTFNQGAAPNSRVNAVAVQGDGRILIGGSFTQVSGVTHSYLARLNTNGSLDGSFNAQANGHVYAIVIRGNGKILVGGDFQRMNNQVQPYLCQLHADGTLDTAFTPEIDLTVYTIAVGSDEKILVGGACSKVGGSWQYSIARLGLDGSRDSSFAASTSGTVYSLGLQSNGKVVVAGRFRDVSGVARPNLARVDANGLLEAAFNVGSGPDFTVKSVALDRTGKIVLGGEFETINFLDRRYVGRVEGDALATPGIPLAASIWTAVEVGWNSELNARYQVQWSSEAAPTSWHSLGEPVTGNGSTNTVFDSCRTAPKRIYRVLKLQ